MEKRIRKIIGTAKYKDETWEEVMLRVNREGGVDLKIIYRIIGVILDEVEKGYVPTIPTVFKTDDKKETTSKK